MLWQPHLIQVAAITLLVVLATLVSVRRPQRPLWPDLFFCLLFGISFVIGDTMTLFATGMGLKNVGLVFLYLGVVGGSAFWFRTAVGCTLLWRPSPRAALLQRLRTLAIGWLVIAGLFVATNGFHLLLLEPRLEGRNLYQPAWWVVAVVSWALWAASIALFGRLLVTSSERRDRINFALLTLGSMLPSGLNPIYSVFRRSDFDPSTLGIAIGCTLLTIGLYKTRLFEVSAVALRSVVEGEPHGILICDRKRFIVYANPAACILLQLETDKVVPIGEPIDHILGRLFEPESGANQRRFLPPDSRGASGFLVQDRHARWLRLETFHLEPSQSRRRHFVLRLSDESVEQEKRRRRTADLRRMERHFVDVLTPVLDRARVALSSARGSAGTFKRLEEQIESVLASVVTAQEEVARASLDPSFADALKDSGVLLGDNRQGWLVPEAPSSHSAGPDQPPAHPTEGDLDAGHDESIEPRSDDSFFLPPP